MTIVRQRSERWSPLSERRHRSRFRAPLHVDSRLHPPRDEMDIGASRCSFAMMSVAPTGGKVVQLRPCWSSCPPFHAVQMPASVAALPPPLPSAEALPPSRWRNWILAWTRTMRTVRTVVPRRILARGGGDGDVDGAVRARPSRPKPGRPITHHLCRGAQKVRGGSRPPRPLVPCDARSWLRTRDRSPTRSLNASSLPKTT